MLELTKYSFKHSDSDINTIVEGSANLIEKAPCTCVINTCWGENEIITGPTLLYSGNSDAVAVFQAPQNQGVAVISLTLKIYAREFKITAMKFRTKQQQVNRLNGAPIG